MKRLIPIILCLLAFALPAFAQEPSRKREEPPAPNPDFIKFNIDFPGGTPGELVAAIQKGMGRTINAIVPDGSAQTHLPGLKMHNVTLPQLFLGLELACKSQKAFVVGDNKVSYRSVEMGFRTENRGFGDDSVWYFFENLSSAPLRACRFYPLEDYLASGLTVDDITTAVQSGWKMLGDSRDTAISFHKETKLLIAVGEVQKLETIDQVLKALDSRKRKTPAPAPVGEEQKTKG